MCQTILLAVSAWTQYSLPIALILIVQDLGRVAQSFVNQGYMVNHDKSVQKQEIEPKLSYLPQKLIRPYQENVLRNSFGL